MATNLQALITILVNGKQAQTELTALSRSFSNFSRSVRSIVSYTSQASTGVRQIAQGFQNLGFVMSAFIAIPVVKAFSEMANEAMDFERAMVEVQKTSGLTLEATNDLGNRLRQMSTETPTSAQDLADFAAEAGRMGLVVREVAAGDFGAAIDKIVEFTRIVDMMQVSTDMTGDVATEAFGRLATILDDVDVNNLENLGSAINSLGQAASLGEKDIVGAAMRIAPAANSLGWSASQLLAVSTAIVQVSESTSRAGTRVRTSLEQLAMSGKDVAQLLGVTVEEVSRRLNDDALPLYFDVIFAMSQIDDATERTSAAYKIFGATGSNAVLRLADSYDQLKMFMEIADKEFAAGTSLQIEFNRVLGSTKEQLNIVKNNLSEVGKVFMADILPVFSSFLKTAIPALRELAEWVGQLTIKQKLLVVAIVGLITVGLPVVALLGSIGFAFSMMVNGIVNVVGGLIGLISTLGSLATGGAIVNSVIMGLAGALGLVLGTAIAKATGSFDAIINKLSEIADQAKDWGGNLVAELAGGIVSAASTILVQAMKYIGGIIDSFIGAHSPPKKGVLADIVNWGKNLIDSYLDGFYLADFDVLKDIGGIIKNIFDNMVEAGDMKGLDLGPALDKARALVAQLIDEFNSSGMISESVLSNISSMLGEAGDEVATLLRLQLKYNDAVRELEALRDKKGNIEDEYEAEIRAIQNRTDLTNAEKLDLIRLARQKRNLAIDNAATEEDSANSEVSALKEQLDWQKQYIQTMFDTDQVWLDHGKAIEEALNNLVDGLSDAGKALKDHLADLLEQLKINKEMQSMYEKNGMDTKDLLREELSLRKRIVEEILGLKEPTKAQLALIDDNLAKIKELESILDTPAGDGFVIPTIGDVGGEMDPVSQLQDMTASMEEEVKKFSDILAEGKANWDIFKFALSGGRISGQFLPDLSEEEKRFYQLGETINKVWTNIVNKWEDAKANWNQFKQSLGEGVSKITDSFEGSSIDAFFDKFGKAAIPIILGVVVAFKSLLGPVTRILSAFALPAAALILPGFLKDVGDGIKKIGKGSLAAGGGFKTLFDGLRGTLKGSVGSIGAAMVSAFKGIGPALKGVGVGLAGSIAGGLTTLIDLIGKQVSFKTVVINLLAPFEGITSFIGGIGSGIINAFKGIGLGIANGLAGGLVTIIDLVRKQVSLKTVATNLLGYFKSLGSGASGIGKVLLTVAKGGLGALWSGMLSLVSSIGSAVTVVGAFLLQITLVGAAIGAAVAVIGAAVAYIVTHWDDFRDRFTNGFEAIKVGIKRFVENFVAALGMGGSKIGSFKEAIENVKLVLMALYVKAEPIARLIGGILADSFRVLGAVIGAVLPAIGTIIGSIFRGVAQTAVGIIDLLSGIIEFVAGVVDSVRNNWGAIWEDIKKFKIGDALAKIFSGDRVTEALKGMAAGILEILSGLGVPIIGFFKGVWDAVTKLVMDFISGMRSKFGSSKIFDWVEKAVLTVKGWFQWLYDKLIGHSIIPDLVNGIISWFAKPVDFIKGVFSQIGGFFGPLISAVDNLFSFLGKAFDKISTAFQSKGVTGGLLAIFATLKGLFGPLAEIFSPVIELVYQFYQVLKPLIDAFSSGFKNGGLSGALEAVKEVLPTVFPEIMKLIGGVLTLLPQMVGKLASWFVTYAIPVIADFVSRAYEFLKANVPGWWEAIKSALGEVVGGIWNWVTTTAVPAIASFVSTVADFIGKNAPVWWEKIKDVLGTVVGGIWNWVTTSALPAIWEFVSAVATYLWENVPSWIAAILGILGDLALLLLDWIITTGIPAFAEFVSGVAEYLMINAPLWVAKIIEVLGGLATAILNWIVMTGIPAIAKFITDGVTTLATIATAWVTAAESALGDLYDAFMEKFKEIGEGIKGKMRDAINGIIGIVENGVNKIIGAINDVIDWVNKGLTALNLPTMKTMDDISIPRLARGGIVMRPTVSMVGDVPGGEAVIPLNDLDKYLPYTGGNGTSTGNIEININNPTVRSDDDLQRIVDAVTRQLGSRLDAKVNRTGARF